MFAMVTIKFIEPSIDEIPDMCKEIIVKSIEALGCPNKEDNGG